MKELLLSCCYRQHHEKAQGLENASKLVGHSFSKSKMMFFVSQLYHLTLHFYISHCSISYYDLNIYQLKTRQTPLCMKTVIRSGVRKLNAQKQWLTRAIYHCTTITICLKNFAVVSGPTLGTSQFKTPFRQNGTQ